MPIPLTYPGVYIEEVPSGVRTITGVATSVTAFVGRAWRGPTDVPVKIASAADYERIFGGLWRESTMSYAVAQFFANGGSQALVVRVAKRDGEGSASPATFSLGGGPKFRAASPGSWGMNLKVEVDDKTKDTSDNKLFNLKVLDDPETRDDIAKRGGSGAREEFLNVSVDPSSPRFVTKVLEQQSQLLRVDSGLGSTAPTAQIKGADASSGKDGDVIGEKEVIGGGNESAKLGMYALKKADIFNLLCIPPYTPDTSDNGVGTTWKEAAKLCKDSRALLIVDAPKDWTLDSSNVNYPAKKIGDYSLDRDYAALYFPRILLPDPLQDNKLESFAPCGAVAGIMSRTDAERGVWKAPAGIEAGVRGVLGLSINGLPGTMTDQENGELNQLGINCLRTFPNIGNVVWGARTLEGSDILASQWKYVPIRRLALFIEESLFRGTQWVVFEPNDEPLWAQIRLNVGAFMQDLFRQGAFQGAPARGLSRQVRRRDDDAERYRPAAS
jgi:phage tail sheath protein FI